MTETIEVNRQFALPAEKVFGAWLDQDTAGQWLFATEGGKMLRVEIDPQIGGDFLIVERRPQGDAAHTGKYIELNPPHRLAFTFLVEKDPAEATTVTINVIPQGDHGCNLTLIHEGVAPDYAERTKEGWVGILDNLEASLEREPVALAS